jgi:F420-non-reducing hydrogenase iron-sulfur subunit
MRREIRTMNNTVEAVEPMVSSIEKPHEIPVGWEPNILAFACHYCAFAAADLAGVMRLSYSPSVKIIRLPCTGKLDQIYVLRAFERGIDGVFVAG